MFARGHAIPGLKVALLLAVPLEVLVRKPQRFALCLMGVLTGQIVLFKLERAR